MTQQIAVVPTKPLRQPTLTVEDMHIRPHRIFQMQSTKGATDLMMAEIMYQLDQIPGVSYKRDTYGNLYVTKGKLGKNDSYPAYVCHTDTVHKINKTKVIYKTTQGNYFAMCYDDGPEQVGIGGDDFCGIIVNLELLHRLKRVKCAFFLDEENGCLGSKAGDLSFFDDCRYAIQVDRRGNSDIIVNGSGTRLCSEEFEKAMDALGEVYGYTHAEGRRSDVIALKERGLGISCCNLSAGYYKEHSKQEYVNERDLLNVIEFCLAISNDKKVYPHEYVKPAPVTYNNTNYGSNYNGRGYNNYVAAKKDTRVCKECKKSNLTDREGILCTTCMTDCWEQYSLQINTETGQRYLVIDRITSPDSPPPVTDDKPPFSYGEREDCITCHAILLNAETLARGYCQRCGICTACNNELTEDFEIKSGYCVEHLGNTSNIRTDSSEKQIFICSVAGCSHELKGELEILEKICTTCTNKTRLRIL
jgi:tripeptide aminopeptidase